MILVTGATGTIGSEVVRQLVAAGQEVRVLARDPAKASALLGGKVEVVQGDLSKPATLGPAFAGVGHAFVLSTGPDLATSDVNAIDAAKKAGVGHVVLLSVLGADQEPGLTLGRWHRAGEKKLMASGLGWTILRPGAFASNALGWVGSIKAAGSVFQPSGEGKSAPIDPRDIAGVAVKALTEPGHLGKAYDLTGPEALTTAEQVKKIGVAVGRELRFVDVPPAAAREGMAKAGLPEALVGALLEMFATVKAGHAAGVSPTVENVLGRKARTFDAWLADNAAAFK